MNQLIEKALAYDTNLTVSTKAFTGVGQLVSEVAKLVGILGGALAFIFLLYSGIMYITANGNPDQAKKAQTGIINSIIGIVIISFAYAIFTAIKGSLK